MICEKAEPYIKTMKLKASNILCIVFKPKVLEMIAIYLMSCCYNIHHGLLVQALFRLFATNGKWFRVCNFNFKLRHRRKTNNDT